jgi:hypothetical protein
MVASMHALSRNADSRARPTMLPNVEILPRTR